VTLFRRLLFVALLVEAGLLLIVLPWSTYWDRNYFVEAMPALRDALMNNFVRGAVSGLGVLNLLAALGELSEMFSARRRPSEGDSGAISDAP
jgi:hypothetical protein